MLREKRELAEVFIQTLGLSEGTDVSELKYQAVKEWDSVGHMALVAAVEAGFEVTLDTDEIIGLSSFGAALDILGKHGVMFR